MPRTFIAASTAFIRRGPNIRTRRATSCVRESGSIRRRRRVPARRQLRAPDGRLRFRFAGEALEQFGAHRAGLGFGAGAIEEGRALLLDPAGERIHVPFSTNAVRSGLDALAVHAEVTVPESRRGAHVDRAARRHRDELDVVDEAHQRRLERRVEVIVAPRHDRGAGLRGHHAGELRHRGGGLAAIGERRDAVRRRRRPGSTRNWASPGTPRAGRRARRGSPARCRRRGYRTARPWRVAVPAGRRAARGGAWRIARQAADMSARVSSRAPRRCAPSMSPSRRSRTASACMFSCTCDTRLAPVITVDTCGFVRHHASAICASVQPRSRAIGASAAPARAWPGRTAARRATRSP